MDHTSYSPVSERPESGYAPQLGILRQTTVHGTFNNERRRFEPEQVAPRLGF
jgi:hypothetical protein